MALVLNGTTGFDLPVPLAVSEGGTGLSSPGTSGYLLTSNGTGWVSAPAPISLPSQTGNNGKYLTTNGSTASWVTLDTSIVNGGLLRVNGTAAAGATLRLYEDTDNGTNYVAFKAADTVVNDVVWTLPAADGSSGQALTTNGSGTLSWSAAGATISDDTTTNNSFYPSLETATTGSSTAVKVSSTKLYFNPSTGTLNSTIFNSLSDATQKSDIARIGGPEAVMVMKQLTGVEFRWIENDKKSSGVIAQELEKVLPFLVDTNENGIKSVNYSGLIAYLIETNKNLIARVEALESK